MPDLRGFARHNSVATPLLLPHCCLWYALWLLLLVSPRWARAGERPELRAFWADGFSAAFKTPEQVEELLQRLHTAHCNAVFAQVRKGGDAYYASHYEPWARDDSSHFDALDYLIRMAHAMNPPIAVHAWINTCAVGGNGANPFHIVHLHPDWLSMDPHGKKFDGEATKIDPGNPEAADWTFRVYLDVVRHYPVDGIHFDFVRYGGPTWGYNPVSVARFQKRTQGRKDIARIQASGLPAPTDPTWKQWRRDQVTALVRKVYAQAVAINPHIVVSAAVIAWGDGPHTEEEWYTKSAAMNRTMQDWRGWLQEGAIDLACPMTYFQAVHTEWQQHWAEYIKEHQYHRAAAVAVGTWFNTLDQSLDLIRISRAPSHKGHAPYGVMLYSYAGTNVSDTPDRRGRRAEEKYNPAFYAALSESTTPPAPFPTDVPLPPMPWKTAPKQGHLKGYVLTSALDPIDGATVTARGHGRRYTQQTDGAGFYAFIDLPPGSYTVEVAARGYEKQHAKATIAAGKVTTCPFTPGGATVALTPSVAALQGKLSDTYAALPETPVRLQNLRVTLGTDTFPGNLYAIDSHGMGLRVRLVAPPPAPFQPGDVISVNGTLRTVEGEPTLDHALARLTDMVPSSALPEPKLTSGSDLTMGHIPNGVPAHIHGMLMEAHPNSFVLDLEGPRVEVPLTGRKGFGVEDGPLTLPPAAVGAQVDVVGIVSVGLADDGKTPRIRLLPLAADSIHVLPAATTWLQSRIAHRMVLCGVAILTPLIVLLLRKKRQTHRT